MLRKFVRRIPPFRRLYQAQAALAEEQEALLAKYRALRQERNALLRERNRLLGKSDRLRTERAQLARSQKSVESDLEKLRGKWERLDTPEELSISIERSDHSHPMSDLVGQAFETALKGDGALPQEVLAIEGMSGRKYRRFINALVSTISDARYLEVGVHKGSTACAAVYGNAIDATLIDNWSQFEGQDARLAFEDNMARFTTPGLKLQTIDEDFRAVAPDAIGSFNIYLFDGPHSEADQYDGIALMQPALDNDYVLIVDDWNWPEVRAGTMSALRDLNSKICFKLEVRTTADDGYPVFDMGRSDWHNGYFIACIRKRGDAG